MSVDPELAAQLDQLLAPDLDAGPGLDLDAGPDLADADTAARRLGLLGHLNREIAETAALFAAHRAELQARLEQLDALESERLTPLTDAADAQERWLSEWQKAHLRVDRHGKTHGLTVVLPTGRLRLGRTGTRVEITDRAAFVEWAREHHPDWLRTPEPAPPPEPVPDLNAVKAGVDLPADARSVTAGPHAVVARTPRSFTAEPS